MWENRMPNIIQKKKTKFKQVLNFNLKSWKKSRNGNENENMYQTTPKCLELFGYLTISGVYVVFSSHTLDNYKKSHWPTRPTP